MRTLGQQIADIGIANNQICYVYDYFSKPFIHLTKCYYAKNNQLSQPLEYSHLEDNTEIIHIISSKQVEYYLKNNWIYWSGESTEVTQTNKAIRNRVVLLHRDDELAKKLLKQGCEQQIDAIQQQMDKMDDTEVSEDFWD